MFAATVANKKTIEFLLHSGCLANQKNNKNLYAFDYAAKEGNLEALEILKNSIRYSKKALYLAVISNQIEVIDWLFINGFDFNTKNDQGILVIFFSENVFLLKNYLRSKLKRL